MSRARPLPPSGDRSKAVMTTRCVSAFMPVGLAAARKFIVACREPRAALRRPCLSGGPVDRFVQIDSYLHVYLERDDLRAFDCDLRLVKAFAHYTGDRREEIRSRYQRVHDDVLYEKQL
jgi:hypothetical protein